MSSNKEQLIDGLYADVVGNDELVVSKDAIVDSISDILHQYNLSTDMSFIEKITTMKFDKKSESIDLSGMPQDLQNAAYLPVNTIADIALRQDLDMLISQIPEWFTALQITRDAVCESDVVTGRLARSITFDRTSMDNLDKDNVISKIEEVEERLELHQLIKNHVVFNTLEHGEGYLYVVPDAKVFEDLYKYRTNSANMKSNSAINTFDTSSSLLNGYGESAVEISLNDTIINDSSTSNDKIKKMHKNGIFTEAEIIEMRPSYHMKPMNDESKELKSKEEEDDAFDRTIEEIAKNISCITEDISLPVIEESAHDLRYVYYNKYRNDQECVQEVKTFFEQVMDSSTNDSCISNNFKNVKGVYLRILPATKLIPIRVDRSIIGYYYISDMTRPEQSGERKNSGLSGYTLRSPSIGFDTFQPDQMFCEKLANKIINNFNMKFMRDNTALHKQIVAILQSHKFNEQMLRFIFIPAEYVIQFAINKDGMGKGHSMLEPGIVTARMYMFLKLYSLLYQ